MYALWALACASAGTYADEPSPNHGLLGDWGGLRTRLYQQSVDFQLGYTTEQAYNAHGGDSHLLRNADQMSPFSLGCGALPPCRRRSALVHPRSGCKRPRAIRR
jgi:carbohydrate-selective porin OprB